MVDSKEENMSEVDNLETRTSIIDESLPDDVVFDNILARVPAHDIHSAARLVCHKWYQTIRTHDFVRAHLHQSTCGLVFQRNYSDVRNKTLTFPTPKGIEISNDKFTGDALSSCNGLVLERHNYKKTFRITNPATNQHLDLPVFTPGEAFYYKSAIAYAVASKEYKVVCPFLYDSRKTGCAILTVGVDEDWKRSVDIRHLSPSAKDLLLTQDPTSTTDGFVHWAAQCSEFVVTLNVETEIITQFPAVPPSFCDGETKLCYSYLPMGSCLSLLIARENNESFPIWEQVWVMKPETGEWTKMNMSIDSESLMRASQGVSDLSSILYPVGWLKFREVLVFQSLDWSSGSQIHIAYNVRTHEIESSFELDFIPTRFIVHRDSLVWLD